MIELGDKIKLEGFETLDPAALIVVKKLIGSFAKRYTESNGEFQSFLIWREENKVKASITADNNTKEHEAEANNLFFSLSQSLEAIK